MELPTEADKEAARGALRALIETQRWASLATVEGDGAPLASLVAYAVEPENDGLLIHVSRLAAHTRNLLERPAVSLAVTEPDPGEGDPQRLARLSLQGRAEPIGRDHPDHPAAKARYLARLPDAEPLFDFGDFTLVRIRIQKARWVGGFGRAFSYSPPILTRQGG